MKRNSSKVVGFVCFADGDVIQFVAQGDSSYPDELSQLSRVVVDALKETVAYVVDVQTAPSED